MSNNEVHPPQLERNKVTHEAHRREVLWQITIPLVVGLLLVITACVLPVAAVVQGNGVRVWADISAIWLILPTMILSLIPLALLGGLVYGITLLLGKTPAFFFRVQGVFNQVRDTVRQYADKTVEPVLKIRSFFAKADAVRAHKPAQK